MADRPVEELAAIIIRQERTALTNALDAAVRTFDSPPDGSARSIDKKTIDVQGSVAKENLHGMAASLAEDAYNILRSMDQYAQAIQHVLTGDQMLPLPLSSMFRSIHECALVLCPLFDPAIQSDERIARMGAMHLAKAQGGLDALQAFPQNQQKEKQKKTEAVAGIQQYMKKAGYEIHAHKDNPPSGHQRQLGNRQEVLPAGKHYCGQQAVYPGNSLQLGSWLRGHTRPSLVQQWNEWRMGHDCSWDRSPTSGYQRCFGGHPSGIRRCRRQATPSTNSHPAARSSCKNASRTPRRGL